MAIHDLMYVAVVVRVRGTSCHLVVLPLQAEFQLNKQTGIRIMSPCLPLPLSPLVTSSVLLGHASVLTTERYLGCKQNLEEPVKDRFGCLFPKILGSR